MAIDSNGYMLEPQRTKTVDTARNVFISTVFLAYFGVIGLFGPSFVGLAKHIVRLNTFFMLD